MDTRFAAGVAPAPGVAGVDPSIALERRYAAPNYDPLPVVLTRGEGSWLWDEHGKRYLDMMSAYSAVSCGHAHPRIVATLIEQAQKLAVTSRAFHNPILPRLFERLATADRARSRDSVERRRRGRRDGAEDRAQVGLPGQRHPRGQGRDHRLPQQFPRPLDHHRRFFVRAAIPRRLRPVRAGVQGHSVRRRGCARSRDRPQHRGVPGRADPGRGRDHRAAGRLSRAMRAHLPRAQRAPRLRRDPDRPRPHRKIPRLRT